MILKPADITPTSDEERQNIVADSFVNSVLPIPGFTTVRRFTPLVITALYKANNPFMTGVKGYKAAGIEFDENGNRLCNPSEYGTAMLPKTAEVLVLISCTRDELKRFSMYPEELAARALDLLEDKPLEFFVDAMVAIGEEAEKAAKSRAVESPEEQKPNATTLEGGVDATKKPSPVG